LKQDIVSGQSPFPNPDPRRRQYVVFWQHPCCFLATSMLFFRNMPPLESVVFLQHPKASRTAVKKVTL
jgi:hypothetical protein